MDTSATLAKLAGNSPDDFQFWVKANRKITHEGDRQAAGLFLENLQQVGQTFRQTTVLFLTNICKSV